VRDGRVHQHQPEAGEQQQGAEVHALDQRAHHQRAGDDGEGELEHGEHRLRHVRRQVADGGLPGFAEVFHAGEADALDAADETAQGTVAGRERQRIGQSEPQQADQRGDAHHAGHGVDHVQAPNHATVEERNPWQRHQQHQGG
jgi:hypothetical protein